MNLAIRIAIGTTWMLLLPLALFADSDVLARWCAVIMLLTIIVHLSEFILFQQRILARGDSLNNSLINTLLFGVFYWWIDFNRTSSNTIADTD